MKGKLPRVREAWHALPSIPYGLRMEHKPSSAALLHHAYFTMLIRLDPLRASTAQMLAARPVLAESAALTG